MVKFKFIKINTSNAKNDYDLDYEVGNIETFIDEFKNKKIKRVRKRNKRNEKWEMRNEKRETRNEKWEIKKWKLKIKKFDKQKVSTNFRKTIKNR